MNGIATNTLWENTLTDITTIRDRNLTKWYMDSTGRDAYLTEAAYLGPGIARPPEYSQTNTVTNWYNNTWERQADPANWTTTGSITLNDVTRTYMRYYDYVTRSTRHAVTETAHVNYDWNGTSFTIYGERRLPKSPGERLREIIRARTAPQIIIKKALNRVFDMREKRARQTLRRILGRQRYERFLSRGFVTAQGRSGLWYQIFTGHDFTTVWKDGQVVNRLCVVMGGNFCPTDSLIMRYVLITSDEERFTKLAITHAPYRPEPRIIAPQQGSLLDLARSVGFSRSDQVSA